jgi:hypothetical protein
MADPQVDDVMMSLASKLGGIEPLLHAFFSFLNRKTDFYIAFSKDLKGQPKMGFPEGKAEALVLKHFRTFPMKDYGTELARMEEARKQYKAPTPKLNSTMRETAGATPDPKPRSQQKQAQKPQVPLAPQQQAPTPPGTATSPTATAGAESRVGTQKQEVQASSTSSSPQSKLPPASSSSSSASVVDTKMNKSSDGGASGALAGSGGSGGPPSSDTPGSNAGDVSGDVIGGGGGAVAVEEEVEVVRQTPVGNGGYTAHYHWTQDLYELTVYCPVPRGTRARDLSCKIQPGSLELRLLGNQQQQQQQQQQQGQGQGQDEGQQQQQDDDDDAVQVFGDSQGWLVKGSMPEICRPDESVWMGE